jgi:hypothetical protein
MDAETRFTPEGRFARLAEVFLDQPDITLSHKKSFGSTSLCIKGKIFAMLVRGKFVVKLPQSRVDTLLAAGNSSRFFVGENRPMYEWVELAPTSDLAWQPLANEALMFVASKIKR